jgi:prephenate dehydrogenase
VSFSYNRVAIIGVGLLGGSLGLALKSRGLAKEIIGVGHRESSLNTALRVGAVDSISRDAAASVEEADLIVLAVPAAMVIPKLDEIISHCSAEAVVTDVASTKLEICRHASSTWKGPRRFVGSHPMAGSEKFGPEHSTPDLYEGAVCLVEENDDLDPDARNVVVRLWEALGARIVHIEARQHDELLARTSHLPHVAASAIAELAGRQGDIRPVIGKGFRDVTRIAAGRPEVWRDICMTNREAILASLQDFQLSLHDFSEALQREDADAVEQFFARGRMAREKAVEE